MRLDPCCCGARCSLTVRHPGYRTSCVERMDWIHACRRPPCCLCFSDRSKTASFRSLHRLSISILLLSIASSPSCWTEMRGCCITPNLLPAVFPLFLRSPRAPAYLPLVVVLIAWCIGDLGPAALIASLWSRPIQSPRTSVWPRESPHASAACGTSATPQVCRLSRAVAMLRFDDVELSSAE